MWDLLHGGTDRCVACRLGEMTPGKGEAQVVVVVRYPKSKANPDSFMKQTSLIRHGTSQQSPDKTAQFDGRS